MTIPTENNNDDISPEEVIKIKREILEEEQELNKKNRKQKKDKKKEPKKQKKKKDNGPLSVLEMKKVKEGLVKGCGRIVAIGEQYQAVSQISAICNALVPCACDASEDEHERRCGYKLHIDYTVKYSRPPTPIILSIFDTGNGKPQLCPTL